MSHHGDECPSCGTAAIYHPQCGFAIAKLLERLLAEGYVLDERAEELKDRALNMEHGRGFLTTDELRQRQEEEDLLS